MAYLCLTIRFLQPYYHGRCDGAEPEWPPSPLRLFQAIVASAAQRWRDESFRDDATPVLQWLERLPSHAIVAPTAEVASSKYRLYVPDNIADKVANSWSGGREANIADYRTEKDVRPMHLNGEAVHYLYSLTSANCPNLPLLTKAARSITHVGWGVDMVVADAAVLSEQQVATLSGDCWRPAKNFSTTVLRTPIEGTLDALITKHQAFLHRIGRDSKGNESFNPVPPLSAFDFIGYRRASDPIAPPNAVFELRNDDGSFFGYRHDRLIHISGMVRHLAIEAMQKSSPAGVPADWVETYVAGHRNAQAQGHQQFSYLPLPSIGHRHADPAVRRVMIAAPHGDHTLLEHLAKRLDGQQLKPTSQTNLSNPPTLVRVRYDKVAAFYTKPANCWASVTPVILPGHNDHKPDKTGKLIEKALRQSGIEQPCDYEWSAFSWFPKSLPAHKYDRHKRLTGYIRPDHLLNQTAVHLKLRFNDGVKVSGPFAIGAGRHCGLGLFAALGE